MNGIYKGCIDSYVLKDLERLCNLSASNRKILLDEFAKNGKVCFYTNLDPFTNYLARKDTSDYLLTAVIQFIKKSNGVYHTFDEMSALEKSAEEKRLANQS